MKEIVIKYYTGEPIQMDDAVKLMEEYMKLNGKNNPSLIQQMLNPMNPFGPSMLNTAVQISADYLCSVYELTKLHDKDGRLIKVY